VAPPRAVNVCYAIGVDATPLTRARRAAIANLVDRIRAEDGRTLSIVTASVTAGTVGILDRMPAVGDVWTLYSHRLDCPFQADVYCTRVDAIPPAFAVVACLPLIIDAAVGARAAALACGEDQQITVASWSGTLDGVSADPPVPAEEPDAIVGGVGPASTVWMRVAVVVNADIPVALVMLPALNSVTGIRNWAALKDMLGLAA